MASERGRLAATRRSRRLAGLSPLANASASVSSAGNGLMAEGTSDDVVPQNGRSSSVRRFSDPTFGEALPAGSSVGRHSASSTTSPARNAADDAPAGMSYSAHSSLQQFYNTVQ